MNDDTWPSIDARHIEGSPFALTVSPAPTFARRSKLYQSNITGGTPPKAFDFTNWHVGAVQTFTLEAHDAFDNLRLVMENYITSLEVEEQVAVLPRTCEDEVNRVF